MRGVVLVPVLALALATGCGGSPAPSAPAREAAPEPSAADREDDRPEEEAGSTIPRVAVTLWFPSSAGDSLVGEEVEIFSTPDPGARAKQIVAGLLAGPTTEGASGALPPDTTLRQVYVLDDGTAWVDFSSQLRSGLGGGSTAERLAVYAVVDSIVLNVPEIGRVGILLDGNSVTTLNGHLDLRRPLGPDRTLLAGAEAAASGAEGE